LTPFSFIIVRRKQKALCNSIATADNERHKQGMRRYILDKTLGLELYKSLEHLLHMQFDAEFSGVLERLDGHVGNDRGSSS